MSKFDCALSLTCLLTWTNSNLYWLLSSCINCDRLCAQHSSGQWKINTTIAIHTWTIDVVVYKKMRTPFESHFSLLLFVSRFFFLRLTHCILVLVCRLLFSSSFNECLVNWICRINLLFWWFICWQMRLFHHSYTNKVKQMRVRTSLVLTNCN